MGDIRRHTLTHLVVKDRMETYRNGGLISVLIASLNILIVIIVKRDDIKNEKEIMKKVLDMYVLRSQIISAIA